jgi:hypothetical protein
VNNLNLEVFIYLPNILVTIELYGFRVSITIKEHEKDRKALVPPVYSLKLRPWLVLHRIYSRRRQILATTQTTDHWPATDDKHTSADVREGCHPTLFYQLQTFTDILEIIWNYLVQHFYYSELHIFPGKKLCG